MKFALITAPNGFEVVEYLNLSFHMVLAHEALRSNEYVKFYQQRHQRGDFIIVDNGAAELGASIEFDAVLEVAGAINADEVVMPDVQKDMEGTLALTRKHLRKVPPKNRMMVPQGSTWAEWTNCLSWMVEMGCSTIGVPKWLAELPDGRSWAMKIIHQGGYTETHHIHFLGFHDNPLDELNALDDWAYYLRSVDSAAPVAYAQKQEGLEGPHISYEWNRDFNKAWAIQNTLDILEICGGL